jgi:hypothetical protein
MSDQVTITWTDAVGTFTNTFAIENPSLAEVRATLTGSMLVPTPKAETDAEFYARISLNMVNQVMYQAQQQRQQQAMSLVPPVVVTPVEPI